MVRSSSRVLVIWLALVFLHSLLLILIVFTKVFQDTPLEAFGITVLMVPYLLHQAGLPVLQNNGLSGGGWSSPNILGWSLSVAVWLGFYWLAAIGLERLTFHSSGRAQRAAEFKR